MDATELERFLHEQIPLTVAMGVRVAECNDTRLVLTAPLVPNRNHLQTAFGGSQQALATLSGYGLLWCVLREPRAHVVVRESTVSFRRPVAGDLRAVCRAPAVEELARFRGDFTRKGRARITLEAVIEHHGEIATEFRGVFVAIK